MGRKLSLRMIDEFGPCEEGRDEFIDVFGRDEFIVEQTPEMVEKFAKVDVRWGSHNLLGGSGDRHENGSNFRAQADVITNKHYEALNQLEVDYSVALDNWYLAAGNPDRGPMPVHPWDEKNTARKSLPRALAALWISFYLLYGSGELVVKAEIDTSVPPTFKDEDENNWDRSDEDQGESTEDVQKVQLVAPVSIDPREWW